jgi:hypothetical protein
LKTNELDWWLRHYDLVNDEAMSAFLNLTNSGNDHEAGWVKFGPLIRRVAALEPGRTNDFFWARIQVDARKWLSSVGINLQNEAAVHDYVLGQILLFHTLVQTSVEGRWRSRIGRRRLLDRAYLALSVNIQMVMPWVPDRIKNPEPSRGSGQED